MPPPCFVVCGDNALAHRLAEELTNRYAAEVTVILPSGRQNHGPQLAVLPRVRIVEADQLDAAAFRSAKLAQADGLALVGQHDVGNVHAALLARDLYPDLRLVIRMFNTRLGRDLRHALPDCAVLSDAEMAAPELVAAALGEVALTFVRLAGRTLYVARRADVPGPDVVCGIAATAGDGPPEVLPADDGGADLVLAVANRRPPPGRIRARRAKWAPSRPVMALSRAMWSLVDRKLKIATLVLVAMFLAGAVAIGLTDGLRPWGALYTTLLIALGTGDPDLSLTPPRQLIQAAVALSGIALIPVITATIVDAMVNARLAAVLGRLRRPISGHVVVIGLGNVGTRVIQLLHDLGHEVVAIDRSESPRGARLAQELDIPLVVGDASHEETLQQASVDTCRALLILSTSDTANLEAALHARTLQPGVRVVLRLFDHDFARRVGRAFGIPNSRSVSSLAAPAFAAALLEREVIGTIAVQRRVLVIAETPVADRSTLDRRRVADVTRAGEVRVIALTRRNEAAPTWTPAPETLIRGGDRLLVIANRTGLSDVLARTGVTAQPARPGGG